INACWISCKNIVHKICRCKHQEYPVKPSARPAKGRSQGGSRIPARPRIPLASVASRGIVSVPGIPVQSPTRGMILSAPLWTPDAGRISRARITAFIEAAGDRTGKSIQGYADLHRWSVENSEAFWDLLWSFSGVVGERGERVVAERERMPGARWFPDAKFNYAENLLRHRDDAVAIVARDETGATRTISRRELFRQVAALAGALRAAGLEPGDRVAGFMPNIP